MPAKADWMIRDICPDDFVVDSSLRIEVRKQEHIRAVKQRDTSSSLTSHFLDTGHNIDFDNTRTIASIQQFTSRIIREAIDIEKRAETLNTRDDAQRLPAIWRPVLKQYNTTKTPRTTSHKPPQEPPVLITQPIHQGPLTRSRSKKQSSASINQNIRTTE
ncbi:hypothetical protein CBL_20356 [Carabus blaptoides fortunei]